MSYGIRGMLVCVCSVRVYANDGSWECSKDFKPKKKGCRVKKCDKICQNEKRKPKSII